MIKNPPEKLKLWIKIRKIGEIYLLLLPNPPKTIKTASIRPAIGNPVSCIPMVFELMVLAETLVFELLLLVDVTGGNPPPRDGIGIISLPQTS